MDWDCLRASDDLPDNSHLLNIFLMNDKQIIVLVTDHEASEELNAPKSQLQTVLRNVPWLAPREWGSGRKDLTDDSNDDGKGVENVRKHWRNYNVFFAIIPPSCFAFCDASEVSYLWNCVRAVE